jgi:LmbE family N-acetylglucosaminyl deacetylase
MTNQNESDMATKPRGSAVTSDSAGTATRHLDLDMRPPAAAPSESIILLDSTGDAGLVEAEPLITVEPIVATTTVREATRRAAIEEELRVMTEMATGDMDTASSTSFSSAFGDERANEEVSPEALERMQRDARFRYPRRDVKKLLDRFVTDDAESDASGISTPRTLVIVAHPDDESIGVGAQLTRLVNPTVVHVTDGAPRDPAYARRMGFDHPDDYAAARRIEAQRALAMVGVPPERMLCLEIPDGEAQYCMVELCYSIAELIDSLQPDVIVTHPYEGGHTDHDAISFAVQLACGVLRREGVNPPAVLEFASYHNRNGSRVVSEFLQFSEREDIRRLILPPELRMVKERMYACFETQRECLTQFSTQLESFRPAPRYNYTKPPHEGLLDYERLSRRLSGEDWRRKAYAALQRLRSDSSVAVPAAPIRDVAARESAASDRAASECVASASAGSKCVASASAASDATPVYS